jgi:hypothetical protein
MMKNTDKIQRHQKTKKNQNLFNNWQILMRDAWDVVILIWCVEFDDICLAICVGYLEVNLNITLNSVKN